MQAIHEHHIVDFKAILAPGYRRMKPRRHQVLLNKMPALVAGLKNRQWAGYFCLSSGYEHGWLPK
ncbi:hypothetical protein BN844_1383 [Pseudomonas sp. SHC52]|nr:hypothetical protein BN844_1383 [Pseudomonas sp. SHC52]